MTSLFKASNFSSVTTGKWWSSDSPGWEGFFSPAALYQRAIVHWKDRNVTMSLAHTTKLGMSLEDVLVLYVEQLPSWAVKHVYKSRLSCWLWHCWGPQTKQCTASVPALVSHKKGFLDGTRHYCYGDEKLKRAAFVFPTSWDFFSSEIWWRDAGRSQEGGALPLWYMAVLGEQLNTIWFIHKQRPKRLRATETHYSN